jgi:starch synthase
MKILFVCAEVAPYDAVGGLSQVTYFLSRSLKKLGHDVRIFTPLFGSSKGIDYRKIRLDIEQLQVPIADNINDSLVCNVKYLPETSKDAGIYFLENREYYELRANVFGYGDDHTRFALLSKACLEWLLKEKEKGNKAWWPDIIHCHDWHTSYFIDLAKNNERYSKVLNKTPILLTVHNFKYQGNCDYKFTDEKDKDKGTTKLAPITSSALQKQNALRRGLLFADAVTTVSPTHAVEVLTPEYAEGLDVTLHQISKKLSGILNGINIEEFNPETDSLIKKRFSSKNFIRSRRINKKELQKEFSLPVDLQKPLFAFVGRLTSQKGLNLLIETLPHILNEHPEVQFIVLGGGDENYKIALTQLKEKFPDQISLHLSSDFQLPRKIFAGADMILIPSSFEPGGLVALEAQRYGAVPLVRRTGGLIDSVKDFDPMTKHGNGFSFKEKNSWALYGVMIRAITIYQQKPLWNKLVRNCLNQDFSWNKVAKKYENWYYQNSKKDKPSIIHLISKKIIKNEHKD